MNEKEKWSLWCKAGWLWVTKQTMLVKDIGNLLLGYHLFRDVWLLKVHCLPFYSLTVDSFSCLLYPKQLTKGVEYVHVKKKR